MTDQTELAKIVHDTRNTAQAAQATLETAQEMAEAANTGPTNAELKQSFDDHAALDKVFQESQANVNAATLKSLDALHERMGQVATKEDMDSFRDFLSNWRIGIGIFKFGWNNIGQLAVFFIAVWIIFKVGVVGAIAYFFGKLP